MMVHRKPQLYAYHFVSLSRDSALKFILWRDGENQSVTFHINTSHARVTNMITDSLGKIKKESSTFGQLTIYNYQLPSPGIYFYRLTTLQSSQTKMMMLVR